MLKNSSHTHSVLRPDYIVQSVAEIDFGLLAKQGIKAIMIDLDGTVVWRSKFEVADEVHQALKKQKLKVYIATNRPQSRDLKDLKERLNASGVLHPKGLLGKPFAHYYKKSLTALGLNKHEVAMIGDRYLQDVYGANRAGLTTVLVRKIDEPVNFFDHVISKIEQRRTEKLIKQYSEA